MINIGIIGFGKMGQIRSQSIETSGYAKVKSVYEKKSLPKGLNYIAVENADEIIDDSDIDAVFICTPNYLNKSLTIKALKAGKHVFCEKPPAFNSREVEEIIAVEKEADKNLM